MGPAPQRQVSLGDRGRAASEAMLKRFAGVGDRARRQYLAIATMKTIAAVQGASNLVIQTLLADFVARWSQRGVRIVGVVEGQDETARHPHEASFLRDVVTDTSYPIYQNLGHGSISCRLDAAGVIDACEAVRQQILWGCDLVILSKFGKLEAARSGLTDAFAAAVESDTPILTAVSPMFACEWRAFSGALADFAPPSAAALDRWWRAVASSRSQYSLRRAS
jgi:Protein of unknown function (DUF2478)